MYETMLIYMLLLIVINNSDAKINESYIMSFVYGSSIPGEELSYYYRGEIPPLTPKYVHKIEQSALNSRLEKNFTYLIVEYVSPMSKVDIEYNPEESILSFYVRLPFITIEFGVAAYALKLATHSK